MISYSLFDFVDFSLDFFTKAYLEINTIEFTYTNMARQNYQCLVPFYIPIRMYGSETWTLTKEKARRLDGAYTRLLRRALNVDYQQHMTNEALCQDLPRLSEVARDRRLKFTGHCVRAEQQPCSKLVLWRPTHGRARQGRPRKSYIDVLVEDTTFAVQDLPNAMRDRKIWRARCCYAN